MPGAYYSLIVSEHTRADSREQARELSADASQYGAPRWTIIENPIHLLSMSKI